MRVAHVHRIAGIGGSERHLLTLLPALAELGVEPTLVGLDAPVAEADRFYEQLKVPSVRLPSPRDLDPALAFRLARTLRRLRPDLVHTHLVHGDVYGALGGLPLVSTKHNDDPFRTGPFRWVERLLARRARALIAITDSLARFLVDDVGLPAEKVRVVRYGLDELPAAWGANSEAGVPDGARILLAAGRLTEQKGFDVALRALPAIRERHPDAVLLVLGDGPLRGRLAADGAFFPGKAGDVAAWLRRAELFLHPARWEGFGLVVLEAMLAARPVVASQVSALPELVADGETGLLVPPDDPKALAAAVVRLLDDPQFAARLGAAGLARARAEFSVERMARETLAVYRSALTA